MRFERAGFAFDYPENWSVDVSDGAAMVTLSSPDGGFWTVSAHAPGGEPLRLAEAVARQMSREYADIDVESVTETVAGHELRGFDFNFYCLDLTNTAEVRVLGTPTAVYLVFCQAEDRDWERIGNVFAALKTSLVNGLPPAVGV
ncbi:MAG: hypothetical protein ACOYK7_04145 [Pirellulales bacterium]|jgi:hypothetical protein